MHLSHSLLRVLHIIIYHYCEDLPMKREGDQIKMDYLS